MAAAPSRLLWEEWSVDYLDQIHPAIVSSGEDAGGCPPVWAGNLLAWNRVESSQLPTTMTGNRLVAISDGSSGDRVIYSIGGIPIDIRRSRSLSECNTINNAVELTKINNETFDSTKIFFITKF
jgi:hypothetical protein